MPRAHRLKPITVSHEQVLHAYTSPPVASEKGCLPTLIVTPPVPVSASDFQIHFFSPSSVNFPLSPPLSAPPSRTTYYSRVTSGLRNVFIAKVEKEQPASPTQSIFEEKEGLIGGGTWSPIPRSEFAYTAVPTSDPEGAIRLEEEEEDDRFEEEEELSNQSFLARLRGTTIAARQKRLRVALILSLPVAVVAFHLVTHHLGFGFGCKSFGDDAPVLDASI